MIKQIKLNKKANFGGMLLFFVFVGVVLVIGIFLAFFSSIMNFVFDVTVPELNDLGVIGATNFTQATDATITPLNNTVQSLTWFTGIVYVLLLVGCLVLATAVSRFGMSKWLMAFFIVSAIAVIFASIFVSQIYEDFYNDTDEIGTILKEHTILSYLILYSPAIMSVIIFLSGIIMFSGMGQEEFV